MMVYNFGSMTTRLRQTTYEKSKRFIYDMPISYLLIFLDTSNMHKDQHKHARGSVSLEGENMEGLGGEERERERRSSPLPGKHLGTQHNACEPKRHVNKD